MSLGRWCRWCKGFSKYPSGMMPRTFLVVAWQSHKFSKKPGTFFLTKVRDISEYSERQNNFEQND
jgi:hypothetical protein